MSRLLFQLYLKNRKIISFQRLTNSLPDGENVAKL